MKAVSVFRKVSGLIVLSALALPVAARDYVVTSALDTPTVGAPGGDGIPMDPPDIPMDPGDIPMDPGDIPVGPDDIPMDPGDSPVGPDDIPMDPGDSPVGPDDIPMSPDDIPSFPKPTSRMLPGADMVLTLRQVIDAANMNADTQNADGGDEDGDTVSFAEGIEMIQLTGPLPEITDDLIIQGPITITGNQLFEIFTVNTADAPGADNRVQIVDATLDSGMTTEGGAALFIAAGSSVTISGGAVSNNVSMGDGAGGIQNEGALTIVGGTEFVANSTTGENSRGGAINSSGSLSISQAMFESNFSGVAGGAIAIAGGESNTISSGTFTSNASGFGGAVHVGNSADVSIVAGSFMNNVALEGGALWNGQGTMSISGGTYSGNSAGGSADGGGTDGQGGGAIFVEAGGTLEIDSGTSIAGNLANGDVSSGGGIFVNEGATLTADGISLTGNSANRAGGGIEMRAGSTVTLNNVTLGSQGSGNTANQTAAGAGGNGGGLHMTGNATLNIMDSTVSGNVAAAEGGGLWNGVQGTMDLVNVLVSGNSADGDDADNGGGGIFNNAGFLTADEDTAIIRNDALGVSGSGGGIFNSGGRMTLTGTTVSENLANRAGGGIETRHARMRTEVIDVFLNDVVMEMNGAGIGDGTAANPGNGGALHVTSSDPEFGANIVIAGGRFAMNLAAREGGALWNDGGSLITVRQMTSDGEQDVIPEDAVIEMNVASGAEAHDGGGGIFNNGGEMVISDTLITNNSADGAAGSGGGIFNLGTSQGGIIELTDSVVSENFATRAGAGIEDRSDAGVPTQVTINFSTVDANTAGDAPGNGGGIHNTGPESSVNVVNTTISNNTASNEGGGLWVFSGSEFGVFNSTVFGNSTPDDAGGGGGIFIQPLGILTAINATIAENSSGNVSGGGVRVADGSSDAGSFNPTNTLIADNTGNGGPDVFGDLEGSSNLISNTQGAILSGTNQTGVDPELDSNGLVDNGGPTMTVAIFANSPALDAGNNNACNSANVGQFDQRGEGFDREFDGDGDGIDVCDIGAYELSSLAALTVTSGPNSTNGQMVSVPAGTQDVQALALTVSNDANEAITISSISGSFSGTGNFLVDISGVQLIIDDNDNGRVDAGENAEPSANFSVNVVNDTFEVTFDPVTLDPEEVLSAVMIVDFASDLDDGLVAMGLITGGSMMLMGLAGIGGLGTRRKLAILTVIFAAMAISACDGSRNNNNAGPGIGSGITGSGGNGGGGGITGSGGDGGGGLPPPGGNGGGAPTGQSETYQFTLEEIEAEGESSGPNIQVNGLNANGTGPELTVTEM